MSYTINDIATILNVPPPVEPGSLIDHLVIDSRKIVFPLTTLFFALPGPRRDGHDFIAEVYNRGVRNFVVHDSYIPGDFSEANFLKVRNVLQALQLMAAHHRRQFDIPVIGITGSNGKTIVKEWLYQLLSTDHNIVRSPRSYNSQIGVPLSVWLMNSSNTLAIFEAGVSLPGEMEKLAEIIRPAIGVLTNIGEAHSEGFLHYDHKFSEKVRLFEQCPITVARGKEVNVEKEYLEEQLETKFVTWGAAPVNDLVVKEVVVHEAHTDIRFLYKEQEFKLYVPFTDEASIENVISCTMVMLLLNYEPAVINERVRSLRHVEMRLQQKKGVNDCYIINDSYSNDPYSLSIALQYLKQQAGDQPTTVILSDFLEASGDKKHLYRHVAYELEQRHITRLIGIGNEILHNINNIIECYNGQFICFRNTDDFFSQVTTHQFKDEYVLLKGARVFEFEKISNWLEQKVHQTVMEVNLTAMIHNLKVYQQHLQPAVKVMAMVKAFSYGSGAGEVARVLQFHKIDYLAVAYADEGVELRKAGISLPIMVMNPDEMSFDSLIQYNLEPEIYGMHILKGFDEYLSRQAMQQFPVHIKVDTGMHRLGFDLNEIQGLCTYLTGTNTIAVRSVFSHLVASDAAMHDDFTLQQAHIFEDAAQQIEDCIGYGFLKHIGNSSAINRHPQLQYDMVRLGIGLYGVDSSKQIQKKLQTVATLRSTISQVKKIKAGDTVGYNRAGVANRESVIATVRIGYADGLSRHLGTGKGKIWVRGKLAPIIGSVCMDMTMIDITGIPGVSVGEEVEIFGKNIPVQSVAEWSDTIPYEILTSVSQRVKRIYVEE